MSISRLDDRNVSDPIIRAYMHRAVVAKCNSYDSDLIPHDIAQDEIYRPDLIAQRVGNRRAALGYYPCLWPRG